MLDKVKGCRECQSNQSAPAVTLLQPWVWPSRPWARIHIDYAGPFLGQMFLIVIDAHSKWIPMHSTTSTATIQNLQTIFSRFSLPEQVVSDNGRNFVSAEFEDFISTISSFIK